MFGTWGGFLIASRGSERECCFFGTGVFRSVRDEDVWENSEPPNVAEWAGTIGGSPAW